MSENTDLLALFRASESGEARGSEQLFAALYTELHRLAQQQISRGGAEVTLSATTLLHEAYLDVAGREGLDFPDRARFMGYAARAMRGIMIDHARRSRAGKRGGGVIELRLGGEDELPIAAETNAPELERLSQALDDLAALEPKLAELVDLHFFCGFALVEIADMQAKSERTVQREWRKARLLLHRALQESNSRDA